MKAVFWDIDGTLMSANGATSAAYQRTIEELHGRSTKPRYMAGLTDPLIIKNTLLEAGIDQKVDSDYLKMFMEIYSHNLREELIAKEGYAFPGVRECVIELSSKAIQGLLTGNMEVGAQIKVRHIGLEGYFQLGGYGDDSSDRNEIAKAAAKRLHDMFQGRITDIVVLGDTLHDANCAAAIGARMIGVSLKPSSFGLTPENTYHIFTDLSDTKKVLEAILK